MVAWGHPFEQCALCPLKIVHRVPSQEGLISRCGTVRAWHHASPEHAGRGHGAGILAVSPTQAEAEWHPLVSARWQAGRTAIDLVLGRRQVTLGVGARQWQRDRWPCQTGSTRTRLI